jgi:hypothetical protein
LSMCLEAKTEHEKDYNDYSAQMTFSHDSIYGKKRDLL